MEALEPNAAENQFDYFIRSLAVAAITEFFTAVENDDLPLEIGIVLSCSPDHLHQGVGIYRLYFFLTSPAPDSAHTFVEPCF